MNRVSTLLCSELRLRLYPFPKDFFEITEHLPGRGFFPGGDGLWRSERDYTVKVFPSRPVMFVGQDFDCWTGYKFSLERKEEDGSTWRSLLDLIDKAGADREQCFFTNLFPEVRKGTKNTGRSPALVDLEFVRRSVKFLEFQIEQTRPRGIAFLGLHSFRESMKVWKPNQARQLDRIKSIDRERLAFSKVQLSNQEYPTAFLVHPSYPQNRRWRKLGDKKSVDVEVQLLKWLFNT
jgi:hypothetical protein